jgi:formylglycine-generating enzyme required for sulfatase activity
MHGNVMEWCSDWYAEDYYKKSPRKDPTGPQNGLHRVRRGGSWWLPGMRCRSAFRLSTVPGARGQDFGFRAAMVPSAK